MSDTKIEYGVEYNVFIGESERTVLIVDDEETALNYTTGRGWVARPGVDGKAVQRTVTYSEWEEISE